MASAAGQGARYSGTMITRSLLTLAFCLLAHSFAAAQDLVTLQQKVLDNGVTVIVWERPSAGRIGTRMFYRVDVAAERPGTVGLTHMLEHFLFKGSDLAGTRDWEAEKAMAERIEVLERQVTDEKNRNRDCFRQRDVFADVERDCQTPRLKGLEAELRQAIEAQDRLSDPTWYDWAVQGAGGTNSTASTGADWMKFDIDLPASKLELFMWTERARVERPVFRQFEAEREVVVNQIRGGDNRPDGKFDRMLRSMTYEASPYGWSHWFSDLTRATREDHWEIFHKYFIPQNAIIVVVGEVKAGDVFRMAEAYWGSWQPARPSPRLRTVEPPPVGERRLTVSAAAGPRIAINVPMPAAGHPDIPAFQVLGEVLSGEDGLLAKEVITAGSLATSARASGSPAKYRSHFSIRVDARGNDDLPAVEAGIDAVLRRVMNGEVTQAELDAAAGRLTLGMARNLEEIGNAAVTIGAMESVHHAGYLNELPRLWRAVTAEDLARIAATYFTPDMRTVGVLRRETTLAAGTSNAEGSSAGAPAAAAAAKASSGPAQPRVAPRPALNDGSRAAGAAAARDAGVPPFEAQPEPLAIAEHPWNAPPWLAPRRPSSFAKPAPTLRHTGLRFPDAPFTAPDPAAFEYRLPNGLRAFIVPEAVLPMAQITLFVSAPAADDPQGEERASLLAAILRRTGTSRRSRAELEGAFARLNATLTITADASGTRLHVVSPPEGAAEALALVGELVTAPDLESAFEAERERQAVSADRAADSPAFQARVLFDRALYGPDHPAASRPTAASVRAITLDDVRRLHQTRYQPPHMALAVSGQVERPAIETAQASAFGALKPPPPDGVPHPTSPPKVAGRLVVTTDLDIRQAHVHIGHAGIKGLPEDHAALEVMNYILSGGGFVSRMMKLLRTDTGITSALSGSVEPGRRYHHPYLWRFTGAPETIARGVRLALEQIATMHEKGVTEEEFQAARTAYIDGLVPASYETAHLVATRVATRALFGVYDYQSPQYLNYYAGDEAQLAALRKLTREDVNRAARTYLDPANIVIAVAGPMGVIQKNATAEERALVTGRSGR